MKTVWWPKGGLSSCQREVVREETIHFLPGYIILTSKGKELEILKTHVREEEDETKTS